MQIVNILNETYEKLSRIPDLSLDQIIIAPPIDPYELTEIENTIGFTFPNVLREFYLNDSQSVTFNWTSSNGNYGEECKIGGIKILSPSMIRDDYNEMLQMVEEAKENDEDLKDNAGLMALINDWPNWIPIIRFMNGDAFCINKKDTLQTVVFLEHDVMDGGPYIHGLTVALNIIDLMEKWSKVGFVELFDWSQYVKDNSLDVTHAELSRLREALALA
ncbi:hypothetical protein BAG01nite_49410 [Brevibacillus agri]|nr:MULTISPECIES: SMI1/KNR4 family protein [Brevibacillus]QHZ57516.1 SMI1/KNR4 family protein [Brevibacillus sp. NSP2.1]GED28839.1 hypothetical protein BAG01nite_49410 [Brevibacillus agri]